jgi:DNA-damage-inducible protein J
MYTYCITIVFEVAAMPRTATLNMRIEPEVKANAEELFGSFGLTVTDAVNVFLRQSIMRGGFPFEIVRYMPNAVTQAAIAEAERLLHDPQAKSFRNMDELRADLLSEGD